ncbi:hypothetical protein [Flavobacterium microcysteis]|uniref:DUF3570 domain-containing protein n=1 Tax=Flavobacterium microcysteis TaxID=2596891 RepID=A0A501QDA6_9FLAO|nr:hypothetical protein [Flavobacterium microcysteis]TPD69946.1 hypothetical protein FJA49_08550 [Flavobacterium microcysteis]
MRNTILLSILILCSHLSNAQNDSTSTDLKQIEIASSSALTLLDNTAAIITSNPAVKEFNINTENLSKISFDYSVIFDRKQLKGLGFYGLEGSVDKFKQVSFARIKRPNLSGAISQNDSTTTVAIGLNVNLLTVFSKNKKGLTDSYNKFRGTYEEMIALADDATIKQHPNLQRSSQEFRDIRDKILDTMKIESPDEFAEILRKPMFTLDVAAAYSLLYPDNKFSNNQSDRLGFWSTATFSLKMGKENYINFYAFGRYLQDDAVYQKSLADYSNTFNYFDYGGKTQLDFKKLSVGYEYIKRTGDGDDYRSVGLVQYKINDNLYLRGGFGKNFESESGDDLMTLFGIRWGFDKKDKLEW